MPILRHRLALFGEHLYRRNTMESESIYEDGKPYRIFFFAQLYIYRTSTKVTTRDRVLMCKKNR